MAIGRYFEAALRRRDDIELITAGPYTGAAIPWGGGMTLPDKYATPPDIPLPLAPNAPIAYIEAQLGQQIDVWLQIDAGFHFAGRPRSGVNVIVGTDPHVLNYDQQRSFADVFYCMQKCYSKPGDRYLPYAYDPIWHAPEAGAERLFDVCLIGLHYENRNRLVNRLRAAGVKVYYDLGPSFDEARTIYNQAPIGLNWSSKNDLTARVFELLGMRRLAIVNIVPDLPLFFKDGVDLVVFSHLEEAVGKTLDYLSVPAKAEAIAAQGHKTVAPHTWDNRVSQILSEVM